MNADRVPSFLRFLGVLAQRERRDLGVLLFGLTIVIGAVAAAHAGNVLWSLPEARVGPFERTLRTSAFIRFLPLLAGALYVVAPLRLIVDLSEDHASAWPASLFAAGYDRSAYLLANAVVVIAFAACAYAAGAFVFALVSDGTAIRTAGSAGIWVLPCITGCVSFGAFTWLLTRSSNAAVGLALLLVVLPLVINFAIMLSHPEWLRYSRWLTVVSPPVSSAPPMSTALVALAYTLIITGIVVVVSPRRVGWWR